MIAGFATSLPPDPQLPVASNYGRAFEFPLFPARIAARLWQFRRARSCLRQSSLRVSLTRFKRTRDRHTHGVSAPEPRLYEYGLGRGYARRSRVALALRRPRPDASDDQPSYGVHRPPPRHSGDRSTLIGVALEPVHPARKPESRRVASGMNDLNETDGNLLQDVRYATMPVAETGFTSLRVALV